MGMLWLEWIRLETSTPRTPAQSASKLAVAVQYADYSYGPQTVDPAFQLLTYLSVNLIT
jgi:hypothetical protein